MISNFKRVLMIALVAILMLTVFSGCGKKDTSFTVDYVCRIGTAEAPFTIVGQTQGESMELDAEHCFKDCNFTNAEPCGDTVLMFGRPDGTLEFKYPDGILITVTDADGQTHNIEVKSETVFEAVKTEDGLRLLLPVDGSQQ